MFKTKQVFMALAAVTLAAGLSGCGRDNYQGTYTGYEIRQQGTTTVPGQTQQQPQQQFNMGYNTTRAVTLTLSNNGDVVTGTYQATNTGMNGGFGSYGGNQSETYQFQASSEQNDQLTNVTLFSMGGGNFYSQYSNCMMQGSLTSQNNGQIISGTLSAAPGSASNCGSIQLQLTRGN